MRLPLTSLAAATLVFFAAAQTGQPQQQSPEAAEAARLSRTVSELYGAGKYAEALPLAERVVALSEKASPPDEGAAARAYSNLGMILVGLEKFERAGAAFERALPAFEKELGGDAAQTNQIRDLLASALFRAGKHSKAEQVLKLALASREKTLGPDHEAVTRTLMSLAYLYLATREERERDSVYSRLLDAAEKTPDKLPAGMEEALSHYVCTGASHRNATGKKRELYERIQRLFESARPAGNPPAISWGGVLDLKAISKPAPAYPAEAKQARAQGTVVVRVTVDEEGRVVGAEPMCGPQLLQAASVAAARQARFTPTLAGGTPVRVTGMITYHFWIQ